ncbi:MAG: c-type cytochrome [Acidobacteriota bacterium]|nr:c-type cytochrome [Acidobacteriota bacterium]
MTRRLIPVLLMASLGFMPAAGAKWERDSRGVLMAIARAPKRARAWANPDGNDPDAIRAGRKLFLQHCAECHGQDARGDRHAANLHLPDVQRATPGELEWLLWNGNVAAGMPSWSGLPEQRRWQIVAYVKSLR